MNPTLTHRTALALTLAALRNLLRVTEGQPPTTTAIAAAIQSARDADREASRALVEILPADELPPLPTPSLALANYVGLYGGGSISAGSYFRDYAMRRYGTECRLTAPGVGTLAHLVIRAAQDLADAETTSDALLAGRNGGDMAADVEAMRAAQRRALDARTRLMAATVALQLVEAAPTATEVPA